MGRPALFKKEIAKLVYLFEERRKALEFNGREADQSAYEFFLGAASAVVIRDEDEPMYNAIIKVAHMIRDEGYNKARKVHGKA